MRRFAACLLCTLLLFAACDDGTMEQPGPDVTWESHTLRDLDYVKNTYFFFNPDGEGPAPDAITLDVYKQLRAVEVNDPSADALAGRAFIDLDGDGSSIDTALEPLASGNFPGATSEKGWFTRLELGVDYVFIVDPNDLVTPIGIQLAHPITDTEQRALAVSYTTEDGDPVGGQRYSELWGGTEPFPPPEDPSVKDTLALKLIKNRSLRPGGEFAHLWDYQLQHIYDLGFTHIDPAYLEVTIEDVLGPREDPSRPSGSDVPYLRIFGLDRFDAMGNPGPDGMVDSRTGLVDLSQGLLMFPALHGFAPPLDSVVAWTGGEFSFDDPDYQLQYMLADSLYRTRPFSPGFPNLHQYNIIVRVGRPADASVRSR